MHYFTNPVTGKCLDLDKDVHDSIQICLTKGLFLENKSDVYAIRKWSERHPAAVIWWPSPEFLQVHLGNVLITYTREEVEAERANLPPAT